MGALRQVYVGESDAHAHDIAARAYPVFYENLMHLWREFSVINTLIPPSAAIAHELGTLIVGSPQSVREQVHAFFAASGCNYLALEFVFGDLTDAQALASMDRFAAHVMPAFAA